MELKVVHTLIPIYHLLSKFHQYEVKDLQRIPEEGRCLVLTNHGFATYDIGLLATHIFIERGREPFGLADSNFFKLEKVANVVSLLNMVEAGHKNAEKLLNNEKIVYLAPGGMKEAIRSHEEKYKIHWEERMGFAKLAIKTQTPIVLAACPAADDIFDVHTNPLTDLIYKNIKLPFVLPKGLNSLPFIPKPVKLTHHLSWPIIPPAVSVDAPEYNDSLREFHHKVVTSMEDFLNHSKGSQ